MEVDDVLQQWTWRQQFDMIHMRHLFGAFSAKQWDSLYKQCYKYETSNLAAGSNKSNHTSASAPTTLTSTLDETNSTLARFGPLLLRCGTRAGRNLDTTHSMRSALEKAGFTNVQEKVYKCPLGSWETAKATATTAAADAQLMKIAGQINQAQWLFGVEGWAMRLLTRYGEPKPWGAERVMEFVAAVKGELLEGLEMGDGKGMQVYHYA
ncbi:hypothetical protein GX50_03199 [[Emmonsia] crescens]|uniref:Uncharacterized protein n=1 Tax=[Emmonsia] crescens TaxID=73230 RepID=A0A2B7ZLT5_9EURO|nr:hypothetical protein GX50_03199 [Emmonsia crescens]